MADLKGSKTHENLKAAFAGESPRWVPPPMVVT